MCRRLTLALAALLALAAPGWGIDPDRLKRLCDELASEQKAEQEQAWAALHKEATIKDAPALLKASDDKRERVRAGILFTVGKFWNIPLSEPYPIPVEYFLKASKDASPQVRARFPSACYAVLKRYPKLFPLLFACLDDHAHCAWGPGYSQTVSSEAVRVLGWMGRAAKPAYARIAFLAQNGNEWERLEAMESLRLLCIADPGQQPLFIGCLMRQTRRSQPQSVRIAALGHLQRLGRAALPALRVFREAAVDRRPVADQHRIRHIAQLALLDLGADAAPALPEVGSLLAVSQDANRWKDPMWRRNPYREEKVRAFDIALAIGPKAKKLLPLVRVVAKDEKEDAIVRKMAEETANALER